MWPGAEGNLECTGFAALAKQMTAALALPPGARRRFALSALAVMAFAIFPGLWHDPEAWRRHAATVEAQLTGGIAKTTAKKSTVCQTALDPLTFVTAWIPRDSPAHWRAQRDGGPR